LIGIHYLECLNDVMIQKLFKMVKKER